MKIIKNNLDTPVYVACSGGVDSMSLLNKLYYNKKDVEVLFFNHGDEDDAQMVVENYCREKNIKCRIDNISNYKTTSSSRENNWRNARYAFFDNFKDKPICLGHNLDDVLETYTMSFATTNPKLINYRRNNCIRPLLCTPKEEIKKYAEFCNVPFVECKTNTDESILRSNVRANMIPLILNLNPGIMNTLKNKIISKGFE